MRRFLCLLLFLFIALMSGLARANSCAQDWPNRAAVAGVTGRLQLEQMLNRGLVAFWRRVALDDRTPDRLDSRSSLTAWWSPLSIDRYREAAAPIQAPRPAIYYGDEAAGYAVSLLGERIRLLGQAHPYIKIWLDNQDRVYAHIGAANAPDLPRPDATSTEDLPADMAAEDYDYQIATAHYYAGRYEVALESYRAIAGSLSRHRLAAAYMVPKTLAMSGDGTGMMHEVDAILANPALTQIHIGVQQLYGFMRLRLRQGTEIESGPVYVELKRRALMFDADMLSLPSAVMESDPELIAAFHAAIRNLEIYFDSAAHRTAGTSEGGAFGSAAREREILDWLQAARETIPYSRRPWSVYRSEWVTAPGFTRVSEHIEAQVQASSHPLPWLALSLARVTALPYDTPPRHPMLDEIEARMADCTASLAEQSASGPLWAQIQRIATMREDWVGRDPYSFPPGYLDGATDLADRARRLGFLDPRKDQIPMLALTSLQDVATILAIHRAIPDDLASLLNMLPAASLAPLLDDNRIDPELRGQIARMAWLRAHLLGKDDLQARLTPYLLALNPELAPMVEEGDRNWSDIGRKIPALRLLLTTPGMNLRLPMSYQTWEVRRLGRRAPESIMQIDGYNPSDGNWWCQLSPGAEQTFLETAGFDLPMGLSSSEGGWGDSLAFRNDTRSSFRKLRDDMLKQHPLVGLIDWSELGALSKIDAAPRYLGRQVIDLVRQSAWYDRWYYDDEMAELLGLTIRATRYGCRRDRSDGDISREAFVLLHQMFPDSEAAKATRYWYN